ADARGSLRLATRASVNDDTRRALLAWAERRGVEIPSQREEDRVADMSSDEILYFAYGSNKRGFSNYKDNADILDDFVGVGVTAQALPLIVPNDPNCNNPNCPYLHRMASLLPIRGQGHRVEGEVFRITPAAVERLDKLEGFSYRRDTIEVELDGRIVSAGSYFIRNGDGPPDPDAQGPAQCVPDYPPEMGPAVPQPPPPPSPLPRAS